MSSEMPRFLKKPAFWPSSTAAVSQFPRAPTASLIESSASAGPASNESARASAAVFISRDCHCERSEAIAGAPTAAGASSHSADARPVSRLLAAHRQHAVDHLAGDAEIVHRIDQLRELVARHVLGDLLVLGQEVEQRAA